ncbi:MAG: hypothetical protein ACTHK7_01445 [Aureliella sp.]
MINLCLSLSIDLLPYETLAYVGPGAGLSMLSALLAVTLVMLLALLAPFLYVVRVARAMFKGLRTKRTGCVDGQLNKAPVNSMPFHHEPAR